MSAGSNQTPPSPAQLRLIALALLLGAFAFAVVVPILLSQNEGKGFADPPVELLTWVAAGFAPVAATMGFTLRAVILRRGAGGDPTARLMARAQATITGLAMMEGGILFNCVTWLLNNSAVPNAIAAAVLFALAMLMLPSAETE